jgi:hypothetical protein
MQTVVLLFASNAGTMIATKALRDSGVVARVIPTPAGAGSGSHLSLSIDDVTEARAVAALEEANVSISAVLR